MAGAGYKLFNTGDVLTAAQVNTYLQEQVVMVFNDATARTTALSGVLAEGMVTYLKSTDTVEAYNGSAWVSLAGGSSPLTTKGDLYTYSTTNARLAVGNNGETLVADSSATTGLRWQGNYAAGKNAIINGDFRINQRAFSSTTTSGNFGQDRWSLLASDGTTTYSAQTFTLGTAPVAGYEAINFARLVSSGQTATSARSNLVQKIESVRSFANQTVTVSFWAKAGSGTPKVAVELQQFFGNGGSPSSAVNTYLGQATLSTSWARYSLTVAVPSISGKTLGTDGSDSLTLLLWTSAGSDWNARTGSLGIQSATIDFWGVQVEAGNVATAFQTATGTLAGELCAAQRYYYRANATGTYSRFGLGQATGATTATVVIPFPVVMRTRPTALEQSGTASHYAAVNAGASSTLAGTSVPTFDSANTQTASVTFTVSTGLVAGNASQCTDNNTSSAYLGWSAEL